ncbi:MAG TPA: NifB/NifX family molybdenum-iron cluster-binding protein [Victivallales bacterium]|nr:NifB/NifX family molybdenum-iron cluster-binding protein [Victivallales bacterium]
MKIAFSASGDSLESPIDPRFGRAKYFIIYDEINEKFEVIKNEQNLNAVQGAGIQSAQNLAKFGVECVVSGHFGPKALKLCNLLASRLSHANLAQ